MMKLIFIEPEALLSGSTCWAKHVAEGVAVARPRPSPVSSAPGLQPAPRRQGLQSEPHMYVSPAS
jgi:hypothetical protein